MLQHLMTPQRRLVLWQWILNLQAFSPFLPTPVPSRSCWVRSLNQAPSESTLLRVLRLCVATWTWLHLNSAPNDKLLGFCRICTTWNWPGRHLVSAPPELGRARVNIAAAWTQNLLNFALPESSSSHVDLTWWRLNSARPSQRHLESAPPKFSATNDPPSPFSNNLEFQSNALDFSKCQMHFQSVEWNFQSVKCMYQNCQNSIKALVKNEHACCLQHVGKFGFLKFARRRC